MSFLKYNPHQERKRVTKTRMRRAGIVALTDGENVEGFCGKTEVKGRLQFIGLDSRLILKWISKG
jgi:hypothetical protein